MSDTRAATSSVRYRERLTVPWWWWPLGFGASAVVAQAFIRGLPAVPDWATYAVLAAVAAAVLGWFGRVDVRVVGPAGGEVGGDGGEVELWVGDAHLPVSVISRSAEVPRSAKSAALGRQLDPAAYVVHRPWVGPLVLLVLDDPDDPTPYWLVSCRHPDRVLAALRG